ncbi:MAG: TetR/AcrR family transcriptional regulator [Acidimicrobiales bacterium]
MAGVKGQLQGRGVRRRQAILDAAIEVFAVRGFRGGALAEIGRRAGISAAGVLHHFGSKQALLLATIQERDRRSVPAASELSDLGGIEMIRGLLRFARQGVDEPGLDALHTMLLAEHLAQDSEVQQYFLERGRLVQIWLAEGIRTGQDRGEISAAVDPEATAAEILAFQEGASLLAQLDPGVSLIGLYEVYIDKLVAAISESEPVTAAGGLARRASDAG